jgi:hypothetical protein
MAPGVVVKRSLILIHRWLGVTLCVVFLLWFPSGIGMMYWDFPSVSQADRLDRSPSLDPATIKLSASEAFAKLGADGAPGQVRLNSFDGRPVYRFGGRGGQQVVYADTGEEQLEVPREMVHRVASAWTGQPVSAAAVEEITEVDQWTVQSRLRDLRPLWKYSWPNGEQVYVSGNSGEVVQYTTTGSRLGAYVGAIPHWLYFTPLRRNGPQWSKVVIWSSGIGTFAAILGIAVGVWMYSPSKKYRNAGAPTSIPYRGQKRWHTVFGLLFGLGAATWAFSGMLSMDPFPQRTNRPAGGGEQIARANGGRGGGARSIPGALRGRAPMQAFESKAPREALQQLGSMQVKDLEFTSFAGKPVYIATLAGGDTRIVPVDGAPMPGFSPEQITDVVRRAAGSTLSEIRRIDQYDRYYLDRRRERPLPVILARLNDEGETRYYIDPKTARVVSTYNARNWMTRWAYHGLHSLDFPWLYNYRPLWDIVVITFMVGGTALCVTSLILAWRVLGKKLRKLVPGTPARSPSLSEDLA